jgi:nicotinamide mononucleotide transporter
MDELERTIFTLWGYSMSILEFAGVLTGLTAVYLAYKEKSVNFLFGMLNNLIYFMLFFRFRLYSVMLLQIVYFIFSLYGYYHWRHPGIEETDNKKEQRIRILRWKNRSFYILLIFITGLTWGWSVVHLQKNFPQYFDPPAYPWLDAVLTMGSVVAQWLLSRKYWDNWPLWIVIDVVSCILYAVMGMFFTSILYGVFTAIAVKAMIEWLNTYKKYSDKNIII